LLGDLRTGHHAGQDLEALVQPGGRRHGQVELVGGRSEGRACVRVGAEGHAQALPDALRFAVGHVHRSAEREVLEQVREAPLAILLHQRADIHAHPHRDLARRHAILAHGITHPVGKPSEFPCIVMDQVALLVEPGILGGLHRPPHRLG
ncbi:hypothetical protein QU38_01720, partial [Staphylococcus aureus]